MNTQTSLRDDTLLQVMNLKVRLPTQRGVVRALDGVTFRLGRGKTLGIVGESGCGKSMLCLSLLGLLPGDGRMGEDSAIYYNGDNLVGLSEKAYNKIRATGMAMIFQDPLSSLNPVMTIGKQITETLIFHKKMKPGPARHKAVDLLQSVGMPIAEQRIDHYAHQLSGGLRQRVAIAIALACEPGLLIADEPTTALDVTVQEEILDLLCRVQKQRRMAMILVTHDLNLASRYAHEVAVMYAGKIVEQAPAAALLSNMRMPYTKALIDSLPSLVCPPHTPLNAINGQPPDLVHPIKGCAFAPRCPRATEQCLKEAPPLRPGPGPGHLAACWHPITGRKT